jgi:hypothetical protein
MLFTAPVSAIAMLASRAVDLAWRGTAVVAAMLVLLVAAGWLRLAFLPSPSAVALPSRTARLLPLLGIILIALVMIPPGSPWNVAAFVRSTLAGMRQGTTLAADTQAWLQRVNAPGAGETEVVPPPVLTMRALLEEYGIDRYRLSPGMVGDGWVEQQMVIRAWPRRYETSASWLFLTVEERPAAPCRIVVERSGVRLAACR